MNRQQRRAAARQGAPSAGSAELFAEAHGHHQAGRLAEALALYQQILATDPDHVDSLHFLGLIAHLQGHADIAATLVGRAVSLLPGFAAAHDSLGVILGEQGKLDEAAACYERALAIDPASAGTHYNLAVILRKMGRLDEAAVHCERALAIDPGHAEALNSLGNTRASQDRAGEAIACYQRALTIQPDYAEAYNNLANVLQSQGRLDEAVENYRRAVAIRPDYPQAFGNLGNVLKMQGKGAEALACLQHALALSPDSAELHINLGAALLEDNQHSANAHYQRALALDPDSAEAYNNHANVLQSQGMLEEAVTNYRRALVIKPDFSQAYSGLGNVLKMQGKGAEALACLKHALALKPDSHEIHSNLGAALLDGNLHSAIAHYQRALVLKPDFAEAHNNLGTAFKNLGQLDKALACYERAVAIRPDYAYAHSNKLFTLTYSDSVSLDTIATEHARYGAQLEAKVAEEARVPHANPRDPNRRLRIGYVSPDFRLHAVSMFFEPLLTAHDRKAFEIFCYAEVAAPDAVTERLRGLADGWVSTVGLSDAALAEKIRADGIDVLMDLAGHSAHNRVPVFARRPAPVQISWLGYSTTTGLTTIDYRLSDIWLTPPDTLERYTERLWPLSRCSFLFSPHADAPPVGPLPADRNGYITFATFNNATKLTPLTIALWCRAMREIPDSRLLLKSRQTSASEMVQALERQFADNGVAPERLIWRPYAIDTAGHLAQFNDADISLDSFPFNGGTTTCESLWMGVPVLSLVGDRLVSRFGLTFLASVGLEDLAAPTQDCFVATARALTADLPRLRDLRRTLRPRMAASTLCDPGGFAQAVEAAYREMWHIWCDQG